MRFKTLNGLQQIGWLIALILYFGINCFIIKRFIVLSDKIENDAKSNNIIEPAKIRLFKFFKVLLYVIAVISLIGQIAGLPFMSKSASSIILILCLLALFFIEITKKIIDKRKV
ncbi:MAG: hypothetical protein J6T30_02900 [Bacteroidales bacterium]|nr:hypothetical protein [Bacteroidales bacterium]